MNFIGTNIISLENIVLTKFNENDYLDLFEYASNKEVVKFLTWIQYKSIDEAKDYLKNIACKYDNKTFRWAIRYKENNKLIGCIDVVSLDLNKEEVELGYVLNPKYQNKGLMSEALRGVIKYLFNEVLINKIKIRCNVDNIASYKVMKNASFKDMNIIRVENIKGKDVFVRYTYLTKYDYFYKFR